MTKQTSTSKLLTVLRDLLAEVKRKHPRMDAKKDYSLMVCLRYTEDYMADVEAEIDAAPDLLAELVDFVQCNDGEHTLDMYKRARAAIEKASAGTAKQSAGTADVSAPAHAREDFDDAGDFNPDDPAGRVPSHDDETD